MGARRRADKAGHEGERIILFSPLAFQISPYILFTVARCRRIPCILRELELAVSSLSAARRLNVVVLHILSRNQESSVLVVL